MIEFLQALNAVREAGFSNLVVAFAIVYLAREVHGLKKTVEAALPRIENLRERVFGLEARWEMLEAYRRDQE